jgi:hypothetical protein
MKARDLRLSESPGVKRLAFPGIIAQCHPDWLQRLKKQVYGSLRVTNPSVVEIVHHLQLCNECEKEIKNTTKKDYLDKLKMLPIEERIAKIKAYEAGIGEWPFEPVDMPMGLPKRDRKWSI